MCSLIHVQTILSLRKAYEKLRQRYAFDNRISDFNGYEVLILISADEPRSAKEFSDLLACKPAQITGYVARLENLGLLKRRISQSDKRSFNLQLTKLGKNKAKELADITRDIFQRTTNLTEDENSKLVRLLEKV